MNNVARPPRAVRPARTVSGGPAAVRTAPVRAPRLLMVDLNRFASFPTLAIGLLVAALRNRGHQARVVSPLAHDVPGVQRERRETWVDHVQRRIHLSDWTSVLGARDLLRSVRDRVRERPHPVVLREVGKALAEGPDAILLSAYLEHHDSVREIGRMATARGVPVLLGGPMFNVSDAAAAWCKLPGLAGVVGAEADRALPDIVEALCAGEDLGRFPGVTLPDGSCSAVAPPLRNLDRTPVPDFTDFP